MTMENTTDTKLPASPPLPAPTGSGTDELAALQTENERLRENLLRCKADWTRLKDWCIAGQGPQEMFRLQAAAKDARTYADVFIRYITSLWDELSKRQSPNSVIEPNPNRKD